MAVPPPPPSEITAFGRALGNTWRPLTASGKAGQNWSGVFGNRFGKLGIVAFPEHQCLPDAGARLRQPAAVGVALGDFLH